MKITTIRLTEKQLISLNKEAECSGIRVSVLIRMAIAAYPRRLK